MGQTVNNKAAQINNPANLRFYGYKISPDGDFWISYADLVGALNTAISNIQSQIASMPKKQKYTNRSIETVFSNPAFSKITSIDFQKISGTPIIKVGSNTGLEDYIFEHEIIDIESNDIVILKSTTTDIYIGISGGTVDITITYEENHI